MIKRIFSCLLCLLLLMHLAVPVCAKTKKNKKEEEEVQKPRLELRLTTEQGILDLVENCRLDSYSKDILVTLERDLDFTGVEFESIPIFSGTFDGKGHTISGLSLSADGSAQGLFRYLTEGAVVQNLHLEGRIHPGGSRNEVGAIAGHNGGSILNCSFRGSLSGSDRVGGIAGINAITGVIENCTVSGEIYGNHFVGGFAGENQGVIRGCVNNARINTTPQQNAVDISDITLDTLTSSESANTVTDIGGIAGFSSGVIRSCENHGQIGYRHMGYNIGGIAGTQSGYIADCRNTAPVQGRKEVGGIAGQMEPVALIEYKEDTLQILKKQLSSMTGMVNKAASNAQSNAGEITGQIGKLYDQAQTARDAVDTLFPDSLETLPDADTITAAQNTLTSTISKMPDTLNGIAYATQNTVSRLGKDLQGLSGQISAMGKTIDQAAENLGGSITDVSDDDTEQTLSGKAERCVNEGAVLADLNVGGIAGAIAMENDLDVWENWEQYGEESLNVHSKVRAVIRSCENIGTVTAGKQNAGGICGWQSMGLVKDCTNTALIDGSKADYAGGISGYSTGFIRSCYAKCEVLGNAFVAGIAGSATIATDNLAMVRLPEGPENRGAILGNREQPQQEEDEKEEPPVSGNYYLRPAKDPGAIDGISYAGVAEPMEAEAFLLQENLPNIFRRVTFRFVHADGRTKEVTVKPGETFDESKVPLLPKKENHDAVWEGLAETDLYNVQFDKTFHASYIPHRTVIQSNTLRDNGLPLLLMEGSFKESTVFRTAEATVSPELPQGETVLEVWGFHITQSPETARFLLPEGTDPVGVKILCSDKNECWRTADTSADGSYLVFPLEENDRYIALVQIPKDNTNWFLIGGIGALVLVLGVLLLKKPRRKAPADTDSIS